MKNHSLKTKQLLLGIQLALALSTTTFARSNGASWISSLLFGAGTFGAASGIASRKQKHEKGFNHKKAIAHRLEAQQIHKDAISAYEEGDSDRALEMASNLRENYSDYFSNSTACFFLGTLLRSKNQHEDSYPCFKKFAEIKPDSELALSSLAECLLEMGEFNEAIECYTRALGINAGDSRSLFNRGVAYFSLDDISSAHNDWRAALEIGNQEASKLVEFYSSHIAEEISLVNYTRLLEQGRESRSNRELDDSYTLLTKAINIGIQLLKSGVNIDLTKAYIERGATQRLAESFSKAVEDYEKAEKNAGMPLPEIAAEYADALSSLKRNKEAIIYYDLAIMWKPDQLLYFERALAKTSTNDAEGAILDYATSIDLNTDKEITWKSYINRGCLKAHIDEPLEAEQDFLAGLELNPGDTIGREWLARTYSELKRYDDAIEQLTKALDTDSTYWSAYRLRGLLNLGKYEYRSALKDLRKYAENGGEDDSVQEKIKYIEAKLKTLIEPSDLLEPSDNLAEWRTAQALLARNAAYIQTYERYLEKLEPGELAEQFEGLIEQLGEEYLNQVRVSAKYKNGYRLFRLRNLTYATMAVNMNGERLEDREAFGKYFLHSIFDDADTVLRELIRGDEIDRQIEEANTLEDYVVYACSCYCNKLLNLIDNGLREEGDCGEQFEEFLRLHRAAEERRNVDEIYVMREAMIWTIASTNIDLVTSAGESDAFEVKAFEVLSATNRYFSDYGEGPYRKEDIIDAICKHRITQLEDENGTKSSSDEEYRQKLDQMSISDLTEVAAKLEDITLRDFLNYWGREGRKSFEEKRKAAEKTEYTIEQLRQAVINDYAFQCYQDGGTKGDETSLKDYKLQVQSWTWDELIEETHIISEEEGFRFSCSLSDYMDSWLNRSEYANLKYIENDDGSTTIESVVSEPEGGE